MNNRQKEKDLRELVSKEITRANSLGVISPIDISFHIADLIMRKYNISQKG